VNRQTLLLILFIIIIGVTGYVWYQYVGTAAPTVLPTDAKEVGIETITVLRRLRDVRLDTAVLSDPVFRILVPPPPPPGGVEPTIIPGRENPFVPF
jgi:hypothetical protein